MHSWEAFFTAQVAASAALTGLLFVSISLNLTKILVNVGLPNRALVGLTVLLGALIVSSLMLLPDQPPKIAGLELLVAGLLVWAIGTRLDVLSVRKSEAQYRRHFLLHSILFQVAVVPYMVGGILLVIGWSGAMYWVAAGVLLSVLMACLEAWVLLVEINR